MRFEAKTEGVFERPDGVYVDLSIESGEPEIGMPLIAEDGDTWRLKGVATSSLEFAESGRVSVSLESISGDKAPEVGQTLLEYEEQPSQPAAAAG